MRISGQAGLGSRIGRVSRIRRRQLSLRFASDVGLNEVLFEFHQVGRHVKCAALDPKTNTEVIVAASTRETEQQIKQVAIQKLEYVIRRKQGLI